MKASELISKLQKCLEEYGDLEVECELVSISTWYSDCKAFKPLYGKLSKFYGKRNSIIIRV